MRLRFDGPAPAPSDMYFRGPVLTTFDGVEWRPVGLPYAPLSLPGRPPTLKTSGAPLHYEATLEPSRLGSVPLLEATAEIQGAEGYRIVAREDLQWLAAAGGDRPVAIQGDREHALRSWRGAPARRAEGRAQRP